MASLVPIEDLNKLPNDQFLEFVNSLFETAPILANALVKRRPFQSHEAIIDTAEEIIKKLGYEEKVQVSNAHPRLGVDPTKVNLSAQSRKEQGYSSESLAEEERAKLQSLFEQFEKANAEYEAKHGFKFVEFVAGRPKEQILPVLYQRIENKSEDELERGLQAMIDIARDRLQKLKAATPML